MDFIPRVSPRWESPHHLKPYIDVLERAPNNGLRVVFAAPPQHGKPLHEDTLVTMVGGHRKAIRDVAVGDAVISGWGRNTTVTAVYEQGELDVLRITTRSGEVLAERTHRFLTPERWEQAGELRVGHDQLMTLASRSATLVSWVGEQIVSIEPAGRARCLCITVADDESFIANDFVTHNTESTLHAFAWWIKKFPQLRYAYATYNSDRAARVGRRAKNIAERAYVPLSGANLSMWTTPDDGQVLWTSVGGGMTGEAIDGVIVVDDPLKDRREAESPTVRENHKDWWHGTIEGRLHPGASVIVMATRWHNDDLSGYLVREHGFEYINLKAIADEVRPPGDNRQVGEALWEQQRPLAMLLERQLSNPWNFASLYQGTPQPRGSALFREPHYYTELPERGFSVTYGVDFGYSERTHADFSVCVEIWAVPPMPVRGEVATPQQWTFYIVDILRKQVEAPMFTLALKAKLATRRGKFYWYASGTEAGAASFIRQKGIPLVVKDPGGRDKFTRAQQSAELWNLGRILVPADSEAYPWVDVFIDEVTNFSGVKDPTDDQVDALVAGIDAALKQSGDLGILSSGGRYSS